MAFRYHKTNYDHCKQWWNTIRCVLGYKLPNSDSIDQILNSLPRDFSGGVMDSIGHINFCPTSGDGFLGQPGIIVNDSNGDGIVSDEEFKLEEQQIRLENEDKREDAQRNMAWFALAGMLLYPFAVVLAVALSLDGAAKILGDMAATYFVSVAAIVAAFYGTQAYSKKTKNTDS